MIIFKIKGVVKEKESGTALPGLLIKAYDEDLFFDDLLGSAVSDARGAFEIASEIEDFREFFETRPDIYFKVYRGDLSRPLYSTEDAVQWNAGRISDFEILIPGEELHELTDSEIVLTGDDGERREEFEVGESLTIRAGGLRPSHAYDIETHLDGDALFTSRVITNLRGEIEPTVLWPQMGFDDPRSDALYTPDEARQRWKGKQLRLVIASGKERLAEQSFRIADAFTRPLVLATDREGRLLNGFEVGSQPLHVTVSNLPFGGPARIYLVPRQHDWREGDRFQPASFDDGSPAVREVNLPERGGQATIEFADDGLVAGAYDFIIRPLRYGYEEDETPALLATDVVGSRRLTGVVIRELFMASKAVLGGCVNKIPISGRTVSGAPYFRYSDTFELGENIYAALDPGAVDPGNVSKMCALYVIQSKDDAAWGMDNSLTHLAALGGNASVQKLKVQPGCVNANVRLIWPGASQEGEYDIVADFGNNTPDAMAFVPDDSYDTPLDAIDGYFVAGFRVVRDPGTMTDFTHAGNWNYTEADVNAMGLQGTPSVQDENAPYHTPGNFVAVNVAVNLRAHVYFPADAAGVTDPAQISAAQPDYPLVVIVHGNGHDYISYDFLLEHFAKNGFVAASIHLNSGMAGLGRANIFFKHMEVLQAAFGASIQNNIGIMGHSRGGEAVLKVSRLNEEQALGHNINAVISLAPTDRYGSEVLSGAHAKPYLVIYGSRDGDVKGGTPTTAGYVVPQCGFSLYDRAADERKSMVFVYKATHNGFITTNVDGPWDGEALADLLDPDVQKAITSAYMNAFFRQHLLNEAQWEGLFNGEWKPSSVSATGASLYVQYQEPTQKTVDTFGDANWAVSTIGGSVTHNATLPADPSEGKMHDHFSAPGLDPKSPHDTQGLRLRWDNSGDRLVYDIPAADKDVSGFAALSFRIAQTMDSMQNTANQSQNLRLALKDAANNERAVRVSAFTEVPFPDHRANHANSKSAMNTVRIPLKSYTIVCAGQQQVDLQNVVSLSFVFSEKPTGEVEIDEVAFSN
ncbi:MAG: hypothetical protein ABW208_09340 [Pyrinomonadaceae bacterium]